MQLTIWFTEDSVRLIVQWYLKISTFFGNAVAANTLEWEYKESSLGEPLLLTIFWSEFTSIKMSKNNNSIKLCRRLVILYFIMLLESDIKLYNVTVLLLHQVFAFIPVAQCILIYCCHGIISYPSLKQLIPKFPKTLHVYI